MFTYQVLQVYIRCWHLEYSRCWLYFDIWSTPDVDYMLTSGVLQMCIFVNIWSTPDVHYLLTYGVLQMYIIYWHMEYSKCQYIINIWSTPDVNSEVNNITCDCTETGQTQQSWKQQPMEWFVIREGKSVAISKKNYSQLTLCTCSGWINEYICYFWSKK